MELALRLNISNIAMSTVEKGEVIYNIIKVQLFGIKTSMTYRCLNAYKKANNIPTIERPRDVTLLSIDDIFKRVDLIQYAAQNMLFNKDRLLQQFDESNIGDQLGWIREIQGHLEECKKAFLKYKERVQIAEQVNSSTTTLTDENADISE